jgi:hypothetical protein
VARCLDELWARWGVQPVFALVAPAQVAEGVAYTLYVEAQDFGDVEGLAAELDRLLCQGFHYDYCRRLGQLAPMRVREVQNGAATYLAVCQARGMKLGNIKPALLDRGMEWEAAFPRR